MIAQLFTSSTIGNWLQRSTWLIVWSIVIVVHVGAVGFIYWSVQSREDLVILRYNAYLGIDLLGVWWQLFLMPAITFVFILFNFALAKLLLGRGYPGVAAIFLIGSVLLSLAMGVVAATLSFINI